MTLRHVGGFALSILLVAPLAQAVESGRAEGTVTINRKPVKLKYAFAKKEKDPFEKKDRWFVTLTDRAISRSLLADEMRFNKAVENGEVVAVRFRFDEKKQLNQAEVKSKALQHKALPLSVSQMKLAPAFTADAVDGSAATTEEQSFFTDVATIDVKFRAPLGAEGKFGDNAAAAKDLSASAPKIADGGALGSMKVDGKTVKLSHAIARTRPNVFDEKKTDVVVLLTAGPVSADVFADESKLDKAVSDGSVQGLLVKIDDEEKPYSLQVLQAKGGLQVSGSGIFNFDATDFSTKHVTGKFYTTEDQDFMGKHKYSYDVTFAVPVQKIVVASELTLDASSGTKLPAGGGDPGKAYMAFDKASRSGNIAEIKKYASKTRPLPEMSAEEMKQMMEMMKMMRPAKVKIAGGFANADHATLTVDGEDPMDKSKMHGTIEMAREDGAWKVLGESWKQ